jgi:hypothetical protein
MFSGQAQSPPIIGPVPEFPFPPSSPSSRSSTDFVQEYHARCTTANILTCVPACNFTTHGYELLSTIDGTHTKFSCSLANRLYSWLGVAALGGFLGENVAAFVSAVISGAAGIYVLALIEDADVGTDLVVQPGQNVIISGNAGLAHALRWGSGGFTVGEMGSLSLANVIVSQSGHGVTAVVAGSFTVDGADVLESFAHPTTTVYHNFGAQCYMSYTTLDDAWRSVGNANGHHTDATECYHSDRWYRFNGPGGDALPTSPPAAVVGGEDHCGTADPWWLSGCGADPRCDPDDPCTFNHYITPGAYPSAGFPVADAVVCFYSNSLSPCSNPVVVNVVHCDGFLLWRLPSTPSGSGYCTTSSGL